MEIKTVSVCGGGLMGMGITQYLAQQGFDVTAMDTNVAYMQRNLERTRTNLQQQVERGRMSQEDVEATLSRMHTTTKLEDIAQVDLVIEAVTEDMELKKQIFTQLDALCPPLAILATNTSILSPTEIGASTKRPEKTIGMHWMNPAPVMKLIEVTAGLATSEETLEAVMAFSRGVGKVPVRVNEAPGGIVSRILAAARNAAVEVLEDGVATIEDIDTAMKLGAGWPMGPFELLDLVGIDLAVINSDRLSAELGTNKYRPPALLRKYARAGWHGRKTGRGFYDYTKK